MLLYPPARLLDFHCYIYEWIDELGFIKHPADLTDDWRDYDVVARGVFEKHRWRGDGEIGVMWIPPFAIAGIATSGPDEYMELFPDGWSKGLILWHVKQAEDGLSFILSPVRLNIPDFGLSL
jgi:hypothetical protein